jgi:hypothetical protein
MLGEEGRLSLREGGPMEHQALEKVEFSDKPSLFVVADGSASQSRALRTAELAGCRVSAVAPIDGAVERLQRQAGLNAVFLEVEEDGGEDLVALLVRLNLAAEAGDHASVICAPPALLDLVAAHAWHSLVTHLCEAQEHERVAALTEATAPRRHWLNDIGKEQEPPPLRQLSEELGRIASALAALPEAQRAPAPREGNGRGGSVDAGQVRAIIRARRLREQYFGPELFADPAWDILLDLFAARLERRSVAVSSLCIAAAVPPTTALRWIKTLTDLGLLIRTADPQDGRRVYIELAQKTAEAVEDYLIAAQRISPSLI